MLLIFFLGSPIASRTAQLDTGFGNGVVATIGICEASQMFTRRSTTSTGTLFVAAWSRAPKIGAGRARGFGAMGMMVQLGSIVIHFRR
jgi:hypothetical protein